MDQDSLVVVTGANGFIASHIVANLLERGYRVRGTVRRLERGAEPAHLANLPGAADRLELVAADLATSSFDDVVRDATFVLHTASPYTLTVGDPQKDLVDPAVRGTTSVLEACERTTSIRRVVITSSMAAVTDEPDRDRVLTEDDWNTKSSLDRNPYYYSKTMAERAAWSFAADRRPSFDIVAINPFMVIGPSLPPGLNVSNQVFADLLKGVYPGIMPFAWGFVDVRDVALAHVLAMSSGPAKGRYICAAETLTMRELVGVLRGSKFGPGRLPTRSLDSSLGTWLVKLSSYFQPKGVGSYLRTHVGRIPRFDNGKIRRDLGMQFRDVRQTILETVADLDRWGHLARPR
jgi:dihydroflavonol-4-reductase